MNTLSHAWPTRSEKKLSFVLVTSAMFCALAVSLLLPVTSKAQSSSSVPVPCNEFLTACGPIPENVQVTFPRGFLAVAGDVALLPSLNANPNSVRDVFRLDNNLLDTGLGTGRLSALC